MDVAPARVEPEPGAKSHTLGDELQPRREAVDCSRRAGEVGGSFPRRVRKAVEPPGEVVHGASRIRAVLGGVEGQVECAGGRTRHTDGAAGQLEPLGPREQEVEDAVCGSGRPGQPAVKVDVRRPALPDASMVVVVDEAKRLSAKRLLRARQLAHSDQQVDVVVETLTCRVVEPAADGRALEEQHRDAVLLECGRDIDGDCVQREGDPDVRARRDVDHDREPAAIPAQKAGIPRPEEGKPPSSTLQCSKDGSFTPHPPDIS
jgi:hypothetical protein